MLRVIESDYPASEEKQLAAMVRQAISQSTVPRLTARDVAETVLREMDPAGLSNETIRFGALIWLTGVAREELARSRRHAPARGELF